MNYLKILAIVFMFCSGNINSMEKKRHFEQYPEVELEDTSKKPREFWINPHDLKQGFYLFKIENAGEEHFRVSDAHVYADHDSAGKKYYYVHPHDNIKPLEIINGSFDLAIKCKHPVSHMADSDIEVACLKLDNLMKPQDIRYLWVFRKWLEDTPNQKKCMVYAYTDNTRNNPWIEEPQVLPTHKVATRIIIQLLEDQDPTSDTKTRCEVKTNTICARMKQHEINRERRLHHS